MEEDCSDLIEAFGNIDIDTASFLLEALENAAEYDECSSESWEPFLEPFVVDPSKALKILATDLTAIPKAKANLERKRNDSDTSNFSEDGHNAPLETENSPFDCFIKPHETESSPFDCFIKPHVMPISGAHNRAISLRQLRLIFDYIRQFDDGSGYLPWTDWNKHSDTYGQQLQVKSINLYHVVDFVIKPVTNQYQCSLVEILSTTNSQPPKWFVSHCWSHPVEEFLRSIEEHARVRSLSPDDFWWICGYANNQHQIDADINIDPDPRKTSFYRAMQQCEGVLLCLDSMARPFTRIWCSFESAMIVQSGEKRLLLDIAAVVDGKGVVLTDGLVESDLTQGPKFALEAKREREIAFPLELLEKGYSIDIRGASASHESDIRRILNAIAGVSAEKLGCTEPDLSHPAFQRTNRKLRGIFAEAGARKAGEAGRLEPLMQVLSGDIERTNVTLNLGGCQQLDLNSLVTLSGHPNLSRVVIDCSYCLLPRMSWIENGLAKLPVLKELTLNFSGCSDVDASALGAISQISSLQKLRLDLSYSSISDVTGVGHALTGLRHLMKLRLDFGCCNRLKDVSPISDGLASLSRSLRDLKLNFQYCDCAVVLTGLEDLLFLTHLSIDISYTPLGPKCRGLYFIKNQVRLQSLEMCFEGCKDLKHLRWFSALGTFQHLETVDLNFAYTNLRGAKGIKTLHEAPNIRSVRLNFAKCCLIQDVSWFPDAVKRIPQFEVDFSECRGLPTGLQRKFESLEDLIAAFPEDTDATPSDALQVGERVKLFSPKEKRWLAAEVKKVDGDGNVTVEIIRFNGLGGHIQVPEVKRKERIRRQSMSATGNKN